MKSFHQQNLNSKIHLKPQTKDVVNKKILKHISSQINNSNIFLGEGKGNLKENLRLHKLNNNHSKT